MSYLIQPSTSLFAAALTADTQVVKESTVPTETGLTSLAVPIGASSTEIWQVKYWLLVANTGTEGDLKLGMSVPASCTMQWAGVTGAVSGVAGWGAVAAASTAVALKSAAENPVAGLLSGTAGLYVAGIIFGGGTAGNVQIKFAQNASKAEELKILKGSNVEAVKVAS